MTDGGSFLDKTPDDLTRGYRELDDTEGELEGMLLMNAANYAGGLTIGSMSLTQGDKHAEAATALVFRFHKVNEPGEYRPMILVLSDKAWQHTKDAFVEGVDVAIKKTEELRRNGPTTVEGSSC